MEGVKFTQVKLINHFFALVLFSLLHFTGSGLPSQKFAVQVAASKSPLDIFEFSRTNNISDQIVEHKTNDWFRYFVGKFDKYELALNYANKISATTKLANVFVRNMDDLREDPETLVTNDSIPGTLEKDSVYVSKDTESIKDSVHVVQPNEAQIQKAASNDKLHEKERPTNSAQKKIKTSKKKDENFFYPLFSQEKKKALKKNLEEYSNNNIPRNMRGFYLKIVDMCFEFPVVFFLILFILFFIVNIVLVFLILNYTLRKKQYKERYTKIYTGIYEENLLNYMFGSIDWDKCLVKLKKIKRKENRKIIISILLNFHENLKGELDKFIPEIYVKLGLQNDSMRLSNSIFSHKKVQGIRELTFLNPEGALGIVSNLINDSDDNVRAEAQTAYIRLNTNTPFKFFKTLTKAFSSWTQMSAFYLIRLHQLPVPAFTDFLYSKHHTVRNFSLKMIIYFQQLENISQVLRMLESKMELTRFLTYRAINDLRLYDARSILRVKFRDEPNKNKVEIVRAFRNIGTSEDFEFLEVIIRLESVSLKLEACRSLYFMSPEGKERLLKLNEESDFKLEGYIAHITDPRN